MTKGIVISLYDYTGEALRPWAEAGYTCYAFDIQHTEYKIEHHGRGTIHYEYADLHSTDTLVELRDIFSRKNVVFGMAFPVCTDLAVSGARHFKSKERANPGFQKRAAFHAKMCAYLFDVLQVPYFIENPVSRLSTLWRKPDYSFHPYEYGGYIPEAEAEHPRWPEYIAPRDAYTKKTCLWTGGSFIMPETAPVPCESYGKSTQWGKLGGKSMKTKNIRSATPRGFARAVYEANKVHAKEEA